MHIDEPRCTRCELCYLIAPIVKEDPEHILVTPDTLEAMAQCPTGAIVWREDTSPGSGNVPEGWRTRAADDPDVH